MSDYDFDVFIIGGGINGCGIARDAVGRGYRVGLAEMNDLASATSSASTKLFHGGLRYLEYFEFRLVKEALIEREHLLHAMPHISWPMRFVLPIAPDMRFDNSTPTSRLLQKIMPWMKGRRPDWLIRLGLFLYDHMGGREVLPATKTLNLRRAEEGRALKNSFNKAFEYSDCWIEDSRLVTLNAQDAKQRGATIMTRTKVVATSRQADHWIITLLDQNTQVRHEITTKMIVNAAGPWVGELLGQTLGLQTNEGVRLVRGSHIVTRKLYDHNKAYFFQGTDGRIIFAIPYENEFTLIGTTDQDHLDPNAPVECTAEEQAYLLKFASQYFETPVTKDDIVWTFSGVRPLYDDGASSASAATRDYVLKVDNSDWQAPVLNIFGGKITTYRKLAESALLEIENALGTKSGPWTKCIPLPGGDFGVDGFDELVENLLDTYDFLTLSWATRMVRMYGTNAAKIIAVVAQTPDQKQNFGCDVTAAELDWGIENEFVQTADDFVWRRTRLGLKLTPEQINAIDTYILDNQ
jgi:glycerol-3-phosphate dehydrogenase